MKKIFPLLLLLFFIVPVFAQSQNESSTVPAVSVLRLLQARADSFLQTYTCYDASKTGTASKDSSAYLTTKNRRVKPLQMVLPAALNNFATTAFGAVILNNDNTINAGSAGAMIQDNNGGALIANFAYQRKAQCHFQLFNVGIAAETNGNILDLYSASAWRSGLMLTLGFMHFGRVKGQQFNTEECETLYRKRRFFLNDLLMQYKRRWQAEPERKQQIREIEALLQSQAERSLSDTNNLSEGISLQQANQLQYHLDSLKKEQQELEQIMQNTGYNNLLQNELSTFDKSNMPAFVGYRTWWYSIKTSVGNTRNKLYNDTLSTDNLPTYHLSDYTRLKVSWDGNWLWNKKGKLWFLKGEIDFLNRNFLQNKELSDLPYIEKDVTGKRYVFSADNPGRYAKLGSLNNLNSSIWVLYPSLYAVSFFAYNKCVGLEASAGYKFNLNKFQDVPDPNTYTLYGGLIFRVKKNEQLSRATIAINVGYYEAKKGRRAPDDFALRLKAAVPFNAASKKA